LNVSRKENHADSGELELHRFELLFSQDKIARKVEQMGRQISDDYRDKAPVLIGVLKGCLIFMADLIRHITIPIEIEFINATSYPNGQIREDNTITTGGPGISLKKRHLLIVEGVVDSGRTAQTIIKRLKMQEPASIEIVTLLDKPLNRKVEIDIKYKGFDAGNNFVIGYGLDESQRYRNLPFIGKVINK
jgi:hypoxanthine phosphoribosyltransferase